MTAIQQITPALDSFCDRVRAAKDEAHLTIDATAEQSGLSVSTIGKILSGIQRDPKLSTAAALALVFGLSLDAIAGLAPPSDSDAALIQRAHEAELDAAAARGESAALRATFADTRTYARRQARSTVVLAVLCTVLSAVVLAYMLFDHSQLNAGLIRGGELTALAWVLVALLAVALILAGRAVLHALKKRP